MKMPILNLQLHKAVCAWICNITCGYEKVPILRGKYSESSLVCVSTRPGQFVIDRSDV